MEISQLRPTCLQSDDELMVTLDTVVAARRQLNTVYLDLVRDVESRGLAPELGANNTVELLELRHRRDASEIRSDLKFLKYLSKYGMVAAALASDEDPLGLTVEQAKVIVFTLEKAPATVPVEDLEVAEDQMIEVARHLTPGDLRDFGRQVLDRLDTDGPEPAEEEAYQSEKLWIRRADHGVKFGGFLAGANAEQFKTAIHDLAKPHRTVDGELDPRSHEKRQADALTTILDIATGADPVTGVPGVPHLTVTIDFNDLKALTAAAVGELVFGDNLSASAVRLLACDAAVLPIVLGTDSQPLDVGMEYRFVTRYIRRALNRRDKGCVICKAPPSHCHAHHIIHWIDGGPTSISNLVLLCAAHHRAVHAGHWSVTITNGTVQITRPDWTIPTPSRIPLSLITTSPWDAPPNPDARGARPTSPWGTTPASDARRAAGTLTLDGTAASWLAPTTAAWSINTDPHNPHPNRRHSTTAPTPANPAARGLSWLTPEAVADLNPWGETGTPSTGP
ncbi:HNH endonuclease [Kribbella sp. NBC_00382]|uniref:HNH endonuclease signature motif containing protein n=1 Tax=Kribbella sp. NBC_00382 TaxID=2975967 RepID=UPI002E243199